MKNKGFTLVELISILTILGIIALITIPIMTKTIKKAEEKALKEQKEVIINAAKKYALDYVSELPIYDGDIYVIEVQELRNSIYLDDENIIDPTTDKPLNGCVNVTYVSSKGNYKYEYTEECNTYAASPVLDKNMLPVVYKNNRWETIGNNKWYDYNNKEWANAVIVKDISKYKKLDAGVEVLDDDIVAHFVWIPRFSYTIQKKNAQGEVTYGYNSTNINNPGSIDIKFTTKSTIDLGSGYYYGNTPSSYRTPDAFYQDVNQDNILDPEEQLSGFWLGKFETGYDQNHECAVSGSFSNCDIEHEEGIYIKSNKSSIRFLGFKNMFETALNLGKNYNLESPTRMMKNAEYGAALYLSQSLFGRCTSKTSCTNIGMNNNSSFITGGGDYKNNLNQSSNGNITGIFDLSGGCWEMTSSFLDGILEKTGFDELPKAIYYDNYTSTDSSKACNNDVCYGHALSETEGWFGTYHEFILRVSRNGLTRGGDSLDSHTAFASAATGFFENHDSFRIAIAVK